jgi:hypothetical protein
MDWATLFERGAAAGATEDDVVSALRARREDADGADASGEPAPGEAGAAAPSEPPEPSPARVVADADVLAADLLVGGDARDALDRLWRHSWTALVASDPLLADARAVVAALAGDALARDWRDRVAAWREAVVHPAGDHPALGSAARGGAMHVLSFDERLTSPRAGAALRPHLPVSVRHPRAFAALFDPASLYREVAGGGDEPGGVGYPGPDREPRG